MWRQETITVIVHRWVKTPHFKNNPPATSECSLFHDFSEKKTLNCKSEGSTCTSLNWSFIRKVAPLFTFFKDILNKAPLIFAFTVFLANPLETSKLYFVMFNVSYKSLKKRTKNKLQILQIKMSLVKTKKWKSIKTIFFKSNGVFCEMLLFSPKRLHRRCL